ncbi:MAG: hypothetical protein E6Q32_12300 [Neisseriales bacterium]|nr:MAG: hypothetical protein E6Q32_12300 [Neisseriales bacterium]
MATKLTSSLRKSIDAEKQSVEDKQPETAKKRTVRKTVAKTVPVAAPKVAKAESATLAAKVIKSEPVVEIKPVAKTSTVNTTSETKKYIGPALELGSSNPLLQKGLDVIKNSNAEIANYNHEFVTSFLENLLAINDDLTDYIKKLTDINNLSNIHNANLEFLTALRRRQKELIDKNMQLTSKLNLFQFPKIF